MLSSETVCQMINFGKRTLIYFLDVSNVQVARLKRKECDIWKKQKSWTVCSGSFSHLAHLMRRILYCWFFCIITLRTGEITKASSRETIRLWQPGIWKVSSMANAAVTAGWIGKCQRALSRYKNVMLKEQTGVQSRSHFYKLVFSHAQKKNAVLQKILPE